MKRQRTVIEESYKGYKEKHFDICPAAEALRDRLLNGEFGEPNEYELGEWLYQHDILFGTEKQVIQDKEGDRNDLRTAANAAKRIIHLSRDLNIPSKEINAYIPGHLKKIRDIVNLFNKKNRQICGNNFEYIFKNELFVLRLTIICPFT